MTMDEELPHLFVENNEVEQKQKWGFDTMLSVSE